MFKKHSTSYYQVLGTKIREEKIWKIKFFEETCFLKIKCSEHIYYPFWHLIKMLK